MAICRADRCRLIVPTGRTLCRQHWQLLPIGLRNQLWHAGEEPDVGLLDECLQRIRRIESARLPCPICDAGRCCPKHQRHVHPHVNCILRG